MTSILVRHLNFIDDPSNGPREAFSLNYMWIIVILTVFVSSAGGYYYLQKKQIASLTAEIESTTAEVARLNESERFKTTQQDNAKALKDVLSGPIVWSDLLKKTVKKIPSTVKLIQLSGSINDARTLLLKGTSPFLSPIFRFKDNLVALKECQKTRLMSVEQMPGDSGSEQIAFHLECTLL